MNKTIFKTLLFLFVLLQCSISPLLAQTYEGDYRISNSEDLLDFNYTKIDGDLSITYSDLEHFTGFPTLVEITGILRISYNRDLKTIDGFEQLKTITKSFEIYNNSALTNISGFNALEKLEDSGFFHEYSIWNNPELLTIEGFDALSSTSYFRIIDNDKLTSIPSFNNLERTIDFDISDNPSLAQLLGFEVLGSVEGSLVIENNSEIKSLEGFGVLKRVGKDLRIKGNSELESLKGFEQLEHNEQGLSISSNDLLKTIPNFSQLRTIGGNGLSITENDQLVNIGAFEALTTLNGGLSINDNNSLRQLLAFKNVEGKTGGISIHSNPLLGSIDILDKVTAFYRVSITNNNTLKSLSGLNQLSIIESGLSIAGNTELEEMDAFKNLEEIQDGGIRISHNSSLKKIGEVSFSKLKKANYFFITQNEDLSSIVGFNDLPDLNELNISDNPKLSEIVGFNEITSINTFYLKNNSILSKIEGLKRFPSINKRLYVANNSCLSDCCFLACLKLTETLPLEEIEIEKNGSDCRSLLDVLDNCSNFACQEEAVIPNLETIYGTNYVDANCEYAWNGRGWGECIGGDNSLIAYDYLKDNTPNIIASAYITTHTAHDSQGYWYIVEFDPSKGIYTKVYESQLFDKEIDHLSVIDIAQDGKEELILITNKTIHVIDLLSLELVDTKELETNDGRGDVVDTKYADIDQDGVGELLVLIEEELFVLNDALEIKGVYEELPNGHFDVGNVDDDPLLEIVFEHGGAYELKEGNLSEEYTFKPRNIFEKGFIELEDTDGDNYEEAVVANYKGTVIIYDVELEAPKFEIEAEEGIRAFKMFDTDGDGLREVIYAGANRRGVDCHNTQTGELIWAVDAEESAISDLAIEDFNGDGDLELSFGVNCTYSPDDQLLIYDIKENKEEWRSTSNKGPYYDIEVADLDQDGTDEIITFKHINWSDEDNAIIVYDAMSKEQKYSSEKGKDFYTDERVNQLDGNYVLEVGDYGADGDMDIIVTNSVQEKLIWVIDGDDFSLEIAKDIREIDGVLEGRLYTLALDDLDQDGNMEIITSGRHTWYVYSLEDLSLEQTSPTVEGVGGEHIRSLEIADIDGDGDKEVIACRSYISIFDANAQLEKQSVDSDYTTITLADWDNSGDLEIIAGKQDGTIHILNKDFELLETFNITFTNPVIDAIKPIDLFQDGKTDLLITAGGYLYMLSNNGTLIKSQYLGKELGVYDALEVVDYDKDGLPNILLGSSDGVFELNPSCAECLSVEANLSAKDASCGLDNGQIKALDLAPNSFLQWNETIFTDSISDLKPGRYDIHLIDENKGCDALIDIQIAQKDISVEKELYGINNCFEDSLCSVIMAVNGGVAPYTYQWSNGSNQTFLNRLNRGDYTITISDYNGCTYEEEINITAPDKLIVNYTFDDSRKYIYLEVEGGTPYYDYEWDDISYYDDYYKRITKDIHKAVVKDRNYCEVVLYIDIDEATSVPLLDDYTLKTYPNPAIDQLHLSYNGSNPINSIQLVNIQGQEQAIFPIDQVEYVQNDLITLQLPEVRGGIYFLLLQIGEDWYAKKIVVGE